MSVVRKSPFPARPGRGVIIIRIIILIVLMTSFMAMIAKGIEPDVALAVIAALTGVAMKMAQPSAAPSD